MFARALCLLCLCSFAVASTYNDISLSVSSSSVAIGSSVSVSWSGPGCEPKEGWTGCYDWIAAYQVGACDGTGPIGQDTCYFKNQWAWITNHGSSKSGSWSYEFDAPGTYEFRVPYCGCSACVPLVDDFAFCSSYNTYGTSNSITVQPPLDLTLYNPVEQFVAGLMWVELEAVLSSVTSVLSTSSSSSTCGTCFCDLEQVVSSLTTGVTDFKALWSKFSMSQLGKTTGDIAAALKAIVAAMNACGVESSVAQDLEQGALALASDLDEVTEVIKIAIKGANIYTAVANIFVSFEINNYFAAGVNVGRLVNDIIGAVALASYVAVSSTAVAFVPTSSTPAALLAPPASTADDSSSSSPAFTLSPSSSPSPSSSSSSSSSSLAASASTPNAGLTLAPQVCMLRHPGGNWTQCDCARPFNAVSFPGNKCRPVILVKAVATPAPAPSSPSSSSDDSRTPYVIGGACGGAFLTLAVIGTVVLVRRRRESQRQQALAAAQPHNQQELSQSSVHYVAMSND